MRVSERKDNAKVVLVMEKMIWKVHPSSILLILDVVHRCVRRRDR